MFAWKIHFGYVGFTQNKNKKTKNMVNIKRPPELWRKAFDSAGDNVSEIARLVMESARGSENPADMERARQTATLLRDMMGVAAERRPKTEMIQLLLRLPEGPFGIRSRIADILEMGPDLRPQGRRNYLRLVKK